MFLLFFCVPLLGLNLHFGEVLDLSERGLTANGGRNSFLLWVRSLPYLLFFRSLLVFFHLVRPSEDGGARIRRPKLGLS